jgi:SAM-dependent methyltransferase
LAFYAGLVGAGPVLELACGTGRLTRPLGAVGLDLDADMLSAAGDLPVVQGDMRQFAFGARFTLIVIAYNSLQLLPTDDDRVSCLRCAASHLSPEGRLALEVTDFAIGSDVDNELVAEGKLADGRSVRLWGSLTHDPTLRTTTYRRRYEVDGQLIEDESALRSLSAGDLLTLFDRAGLKAVAIDRDGPRTWAVATLAGCDRPGRSSAGSSDSAASPSAS